MGAGRHEKAGSIPVLWRSAHNGRNVAPAPSGLYCSVLHLSQAAVMVPVLAILLVIPAALGQDFVCLRGVNVAANSYVAYAINPVAAVSANPPCDRIQRCVGNVTSQISLSGRSWFMTPTKKASFYYHKANWTQMWRSSCPIGNVLQITAQSSDFATSSKTAYRLIYDNTTLNISTPSDLGGLTNGIIVQSRTAVLEFLDTGSSLDDYGLVLRATCLPLANWYLPGCANLQDIVMLPGAQAFVDKTFNVSTSSLARRQDRSVHTVQETSFLQEILLRNDRAKRQSCDLNRLFLEPTDMLSFMMGTITVTNVNMTVLATYPLVNCLTAFSQETSSRIFFSNSPMLFGPGTLEVCGTVANYVYKISPQHFMPNPTVADIVNKLYTDLYLNNVEPYGVIDGINDDSRIFPYPDSNSPYNSSYIPGSRSRVVFEKVIGYPKTDYAGKLCRRTINSYTAPQFIDRLNRDFKTFCQLFQFSCDIILRTACIEYLATDPLLA